jgi:integrase
MVKKLLKRNARDKILTPEQFKALMEKLPAHTKAIIAMGFHTGMRLGETVNLTWDKVDLKGRMIRLEAADNKDKEPRKIPISEPLHEILKGIPRAIHDDHVFLYKGKPVTEIKRSLKTACKRAAFTYGRFEKDGFIFHDLRHSFNTYMRKAGVAQSVIMKITGHARNSMFDRYNSIDEGDARQAITQLQGFFVSVDQSVDQTEKKG